MKRLAIALVLGVGVSGAAEAQTALPRVTLTRLDCGIVQVNDLNQFSDTDAYVGRTKQLTDSCYLIRHGDELMLWDAGLPAALKDAPTNTTEPMSASVGRTIVEQLAQIGITPDRITRVGISHYHFDHIGQAAMFPKAKLMIGAGDWAALSAEKPAAGLNPKAVQPWLDNRSLADPVAGDRDVFADGTVRMIDAPGHTPGHHALLVNLKGRTILLTGDLAHFAENYATNGVPGFNTNRADTLASLDRFKKLAANTKATVIIQHDAADIGKLPPFPQAAE